METSVEKETVTWNMVTQTIELSKLQIRSLLGLLGATPPNPEDPVGDILLIPLLIAELLEKIRLTAEQRNLIMTETHVAQTDAAHGRMAQLCLVDGAYCVATGLAGFLDLTTGDLIKTRLPIPPMETISYNLLELHRRGKQRILNRSGLHADGQATIKRDLDQSADVRDCAADAVS
jgi:hypothetical protein